MVGALGGVGTVAAAQPGAGGPGGPIGPGGAPPGGGGRKEKKEGPAEEAPKDKEALRPIEPVPATPRRLRRLQLFDLNGYMRMRGDYFHRLGLGLVEPGSLEDGDRPQRFFDPPAESQETDEDGNIIGTNDASCLNRLIDGGVSGARAVTRCNRRQGFASANMRLRLEPSLHITDTVHVHTQVDILDNVVLGSTPDSLQGTDPYAPLDLYTRSQDPSASGVTGTKDSVVVKRAWGDIRFGWGLQVEFGRMPWSWGMGMVANGGNGYSKLAKDDIIQQLDRDHGDSVDSVRLGFDFGKDRRKTHKLRLSWDWANSGPTTAQLLGPEYASGGTLGQAFSVEKFDDVHQWSASIERRDEPEMLKRKLSLGNPVFNYGLIGWLRYQDLDDAYGSASVEGVSDFQTYTNSLVQRRALMVTPDAWMRVNWRTLRVELEAAATYGRFNIRDFDNDLEDGQNSLNDFTSDDLNQKSILNFGYALEFKYGFFDDRFHIGFDHGFATGDTASPLESDPASPLNQNDNSRFSQFRFNPAYNTDLLLFRELLGTVSNAAYFKPWAAFYFFDHFSARADIEYAMAVQRQSTLGNRFSYGVELDGAARYHDAREPIFFQIQYGVLFPLGAFNRNLSNGGREDARAVQTLQAQIGIKF
ncbi:MAG: TIGR04551 family protein [Nannocystaceae bacterium]|nr:TIGR04551 family protein [Nannocystaceae bacterium]